MGRLAWTELRTKGTRVHKTHVQNLAMNTQLRPDKNAALSLSNAHQRFSRRSFDRCYRFAQRAEYAPELPPTLNLIYQTAARLRLDVAYEQCSRGRKGVAHRASSLTSTGPLRRNRTSTRS